MKCQLPARCEKDANGWATLRVQVGPMRLSTLCSAEGASGGSGVDRRHVAGAPRLGQRRDARHRAPGRDRGTQTGTWGAFDGNGNNNKTTAITFQMWTSTQIAGGGVWAWINCYLTLFLGRERRQMRKLPPVPSLGAPQKLHSRVFNIPFL